MATITISVQAPLFKYIMNKCKTRSREFQNEICSAVCLRKLSVAYVLSLTSHLFPSPQFFYLHISIFTYFTFTLRLTYTITYVTSTCVVTSIRYKVIFNEILIYVTSYVCYVHVFYVYVC